MNVQSAENLTEILKTFNESTVKLRQAYDALQLKFGALNRQLEDTNKELSRRIAELSEVKEYLNSILQSVTNGVIAINVKGEITAFNKAAERITGLDAESVIQRAFSEVFATDFGASFQRRSGQMEHGQRYTSRDLKVKGRHPFPVRESNSFTRDGRGEITGAVKVFEDLSELRELEEQARRQDRLAALGQMAATVAHEIRNPLGGIEGFASLLARDFDADDPRSKLVTKIQEGARSLNRVVTELLVFTRPMKLDFKTIELPMLVNETLGFLSSDIKAANIRLQKRLGKGELKVTGDAEQLKRVLLNIMLNAVQAMPNGGTLKVGCRQGSLSPAARKMLGHCRNGSWAEVSIRDSGPGIEESEIPRIFNPFYTTKEKGTGLGLSVAAKIVDAHRGQILASNSPRGGALFVVSLPLEG
ncbi:MAG: PAS domain S-box protein [Candidatus Abyssobacteria bacterium SURF_17]|uniref:histidine kinase n=1 Tax=Candidatus Abyssobacteria bacterium SURF_17 TaxID=2093361 RepID=A0A419F4K2_9BACT|nr:MAG: PAS domain S-box protein [Candidatus Abyssubacteria bacterium SURF_17]